MNEMFTHAHILRTADDNLDSAQQNKLDLICRKLQLASKRTVAGYWLRLGALVIWAAQNYGRNGARQSR